MHSCHLFSFNNKKMFCCYQWTIPWCKQDYFLKDLSPFSWTTFPLSQSKSYRHSLLGWLCKKKNCPNILPGSWFSIHLSLLNFSLLWLYKLFWNRLNDPVRSLQHSQVSANFSLLNGTALTSWQTIPQLLIDYFTLLDRTAYYERKIATRNLFPS